MIILISSIFGATLFAVSVSAYFGRQGMANPAWVEAVFWSVIGAGMFVRGFSVALHSWTLRFCGNLFRATQNVSKAYRKRQ